MRRHSLAENQEFFQAQFAADLRAGRAADDDRFDLRQIAFEILGILVKQNFTHDGAENRVAQEFQSLVGGQPVQGAGGMGQSRAQEKLVAEHVVDATLATGYIDMHFFGRFGRLAPNHHKLLPNKGGNAGKARRAKQLPIAQPNSSRRTGVLSTRDTSLRLSSLTEARSKCRLENRFFLRCCQAGKPDLRNFLANRLKRRQPVVPMKGSLTD